MTLTETAGTNQVAGVFVAVVSWRWFQSWRWFRCRGTVFPSGKPTGRCLGRQMAMNTALMLRQSVSREKNTEVLAGSVAKTGRYRYVTCLSAERPQRRQKQAVYTLSGNSGNSDRRPVPVLFCRQKHQAVHPQGQRPRLNRSRSVLSQFSIRN